MKRKRKSPPITMPKRKKKKLNDPREETQSRAAIPSGRREEEEYEFNKYARKVVKVTVVVDAEEVKDLKQKSKRKARC